MATKYQITLPEDLAADLKTAAARLTVPLAQLNTPDYGSEAGRIQGQDPGQRNGCIKSSSAKYDAGEQS